MNRELVSFQEIRDSELAATAARDAQPQNGVCNAIRRVTNNIPFGGKVAGDAANAQRFDGLDVRGDRRCPFPGIAIEQSP
jgi:hypothetical protein